MIDWIFTLNPDSDAIVADEPTGWDSASVKLKRDRKLHGVSIAFSMSEITFDGEAALYIKEKKEAAGVDADVLLKIEAVCDDAVQYEEIFALDFNRYSEICGNDCRVTIGFEQISCFSKFTNGYEKKVDVENETALDNETALTPLPLLEQNITLPPKAIRVIDEAHTNPLSSENLKDQPSWNPAIAGIVINPALQEVTYSSFGSFVTSTFNEGIPYSDFTKPPYASLPAMVNTSELLGNIECELSDAEFQFRVKGAVDIGGTIPGNWRLDVKLFRLPEGGDPSVTGDWVEEYVATIMTILSGSTTGTFDHSATVPLTINQGDLIYFYLHAEYGNEPDAIIFTLNTESFVKLEAVSVCQESTADLYLIYETIHRVAESITNGCLKLESEWYGRTDSAPDTYAGDGCGALKSLTSGLKIRNAANGKFFISMKELMEELNKIDSIGFGLERNEDDEEVLKVEEANYFYQDIEVLRLPYVSSAKRTIVPSEVYGIIKVGYDKWKIEQLAGLDEFNSTREYRSSLQNASAPLDLISKFITAGYVIELTRQQSYAESGAADTKFDDDTFVISLIRSYAQFAVEQGGITGAANMFDPDTVYNFRLSPYRNLLRWFPMIAGQFPDLATNGFRFSAGTGNYLATGWMQDDCSPENGIHQENADATINDLNNTDRGTPKFKPESVILEYPMSLSDFNALRANPYGYISYQCGTLEWHKAYLFDIDYKISQGVASFDLREKYS